MSSLTILLILNLALPVFGISCCGAIPTPTPKPSNTTSASAPRFTRWPTGKGPTFSGADRNPVKTSNGTLTLKAQNDVDGEWFDTYTCYCFTPMCNFPFSFEEFKARGYTLAPHPSKAFSIW